MNMKSIYIFVITIFATGNLFSQATITQGGISGVVNEVLSARWQGFKNNGNSPGIYVGTDLSSSNVVSTTGNNSYNKPGNNSISLIYNKTTDVLTATLNTRTAIFTGITGKLVGGASLCRMNNLEISIGDNNGQAITLSNVNISGQSLGSFVYSTGADVAWTVNNLDFSLGFTLTGTIILSNANYGNSTNSHVTIKLLEATALKTTSAMPICENNAATVNLTGLLPNKTYTAAYMIGTTTPVTSSSFTSNASGNASFLTRAITAADNLKSLTILSLNTGCTWLTLGVNAVTTVVLKNYWTGLVSSAWTNPQNWSGNVLPDTNCSKFVIPAGTLFQPVTYVAVNQVKNLEIQAGVTMNVGTSTLKVSGSIVNQGILDVSNGTLELNANSGIQTLSGSLFKDKTVKNLVNSNAVGITIASTAGDTLKVSGNLSFGNVNNSVINTGDNVTLISGGNGTAVVSDLTNDGMNSGNRIEGKVVVERYISNAAKWRFVSINSNTTQTFKQAWQEGATTAYGNPTPGYGMVIGDNKSASYLANGFDAYTPGGPTVKTYNSTTNTWVGITNTNQLINTTGGYMAYMRSNRSGSLSSTVIRTSGALKSGTQPLITVPANTFIPVGNPYAAPINVTKINAVGLQEVFYIWDPKLGGSYGLGAYQSLIKVGANYAIFPGGGSYGPQLTPTNMIESGQAFFVKGSNTGGSLQIEERSKGTGTNMVFRGTMENSPTIRASLLVPTADTALMVDATMVNFDDDYSEGIDDDDIQKIGNNNENVCIVANGNYLMAERKTMYTDIDTIQLFMGGVRVQNYQWQLNLDHMEATGRLVTLVDRYTNNEILLDMNEPTTYDFNIINVPGSYASNRFYLVVSNMAILPVSITSISANRTDASTAVVNWNVTGETNLDRYEVETSINGIEFTRFAEAQHTTGNSGVVDYSSVHDNAVAGINFYRVKAISSGGREQYSAIVKVAAVSSPEKSQVNVFPNPVENKIMKVSFDGKAGTYELALISMSGTQVFSKTITVTDSSSRLSLPLGDQIATGRYSLVISGSDGTSNVQSLIIL